MVAYDWRKIAKTSILKDEYRSDDERKSSIRTKVTGIACIRRPRARVVYLYMYIPAGYLESGRPLGHNGLLSSRLQAYLAKGLIVLRLPSEL